MGRNTYEGCYAKDYKHECHRHCRRGPGTEHGYMMKTLLRHIKIKTPQNYYHYTLLSRVLTKL